MYIMFSRSEASKNTQEETVDLLKAEMRWRNEIHEADTENHNL